MQGSSVPPLASCTGWNSDEHFPFAFAIFSPTFKDPIATHNTTAHHISPVRSTLFAAMKMRPVLCYMNPVSWLRMTSSKLPSSSSTTNFHLLFLLRPRTSVGESVPCLAQINRLLRAPEMLRPMPPFGYIQKRQFRGMTFRKSFSYPPVGI